MLKPPIPFLGPRGAQKLAQILHHPARNLPLVVISTVNFEPITRDLGESLARDLAGLAIVGLVNEPASWAITEMLGKEWSCYNQAVRLYWPIKDRFRNAFRHPLWTAERLLETAKSPEAAALLLRNTLRRQLLALSTYTISEPGTLVQIRQQASERRFEELHARAQSGGDWQALAEEYAKDNQTLKHRIADLEEEKSRLEDQVANLSVAFKYRDVGSAEQEIQPESEPNTDTILDAVESARNQFAAELVFGANVSDSVDTLAQDAGPPDKIFEYPRTLAEMVRIRKGQGLGKDMLAWLKEQGLKASTESETILNSGAEMQKRTWDNGKGGKRRFEKHLKPSEGTSPDRCVRIYFDYDDAAEQAVVAWVGRHP